MSFITNHLDQNYVPAIYAFYCVSIFAYLPSALPLHIFVQKSSSSPVTSLLTVIIDGVYELHQHLAELVVFANSKAQTFSACNARLPSAL